MRKLIDFLTFRDGRPESARPVEPSDIRLRADERDAVLLADKYPADGADIESISEYRLASLMQYPHY